MSRIQNGRLLAVLGVSLSLNLVLLTLFLSGGAPPRAFGQATSAGGAFLMATEQSADQLPVCFVLDTVSRRLLVYRVDARSQLQLTNAREIKCDLRLIDNHMPQGQASGKSRTAPPVAQVCDAIKGLEEEKEKDEEKHEDHKEKEKKADHKDKEKKAEKPEKK